MKSSPYYSRGLATAYVSGGELKFSKRMSKWILKSFYPKQTGKVLDIACGAGEAVRVFGEAGWKASGLDKSQAMLRLASERNKRGVTLREGSMQDINGVAKRFDLVTCMYDAINCNLSMDDLDATLKNVHGLLVPGGRFVFDAFTIRGLHQAYDGLELHTRNRDHVVLTYSEVDRRRHIGTKELLGASREPNWAPWREVHRVRAYPPKTFVRQLKRTGFTSIELYGWPNGRSISKSEADELERFVVAARRPKKA